MKVMPIFGTRPEAIKLAPVIRELNKNNDFETAVCVTAQHREMLDQVLDIFKIKPDYDLDIMKPGQNLSEVTSRVISGLQEVFEQSKPDIILVQGDTTTVFAASLAAFYNNIKVGHVEAGLRTNDKKNPFPEEINRRLTSVLADIHFCPTEKSKQSLEVEGYKHNIYVTGNTVIDALFWALEIIEQNKNEEILKIKSWLDKKIGDNEIILITAHRRESFGEPFENICNAMKEIAIKYKNIHLVYPVHLNPNVRKPVYEILQSQENIHLIEPLSYLPFVWLMNRSYLILTDSGGVQEEAPSLGKPVLVMRETTERPEGVEKGTSVLVGRHKDVIIKTVSDFIENKEYYKNTSKISNPYGDGKASEKIVNNLHSYFNKVVNE
ncbi:MAG TPA: UDP-N-acetylglucosamine 2-epimerase (non-hydrolyzing) [Phycisphaerales bacterium]|nr:UDP-N-acetylglucosamine 2-epimerase (non-hydrolyzing) [Phycisphaerales bacterium]